MARIHSTQTTVSQDAPVSGSQRHAEEQMIGHLRRRSSAFGAALAAFIIVILVAAPQAQQAPALLPRR